MVPVFSPKPGMLGTGQQAWGFLLKSLPIRCGPSPAHEAQEE